MLKLLLGIHAASALVAPALRTARATALQASQLQQLSEMTVLSIDSGDLDVIEQYAQTGCITDATTNPLFVAQAAASDNERYVAFVDRAVAYGKANCGCCTSCVGGGDPVVLAMDRLAVELGLEIVKLVPGYVSTEVDIRASFDTEESVSRARRIIAMYEAEGVDRSRILVKLAGTWEGIKAAEILEAEGITCNITLVFGFAQAVAAAQAGARLISPFPGRVKDWYSANGGPAAYEPDADPGVVAVKRMYAYYKRHGHGTICMPASWRPSRGPGDPAFLLDEVLALAGTDRMTIPAPMLEALAASEEAVPRKLEPATAAAAADDAVLLDEKTFRLLMNADVAATTKLAEGINAFVAETAKLKAAIEAKVHAPE